MSQSLKSKAVRGVMWSAAERFSNQGLIFVLGILIARQLSPSDFGLIAMLNVFISLCSVFVESGFVTALIRKVNRTESDNSTVFYFNIAVGFFASLAIFFSAPLIADFYDTPQLTSIARALSVTIFFNSFGVIQQVLLSSKIDFKTQTKISLTTTGISFGVGLWGAFSGLGVWALVMQSICLSILRPTLLWILVSWRPVMPFSKESFCELFGFGSKLLIIRLIDNIYNNLYVLIIGKLFSPAMLGDYARANSFAQFPSSNITDVILRVTFPSLSHIQNEHERLALNYRKLLRMSAFIIFPLMIGLSVVSEPLVTFFLTEKWSGAIIYMQVLCFALMWFPIHSFNLNLLEVKGRSDLLLRLGFIQKISGLIMLGITLPFGIIAMCFGQIVTAILNLIVNTHYTGKLIDVGFLKQIQDLFPSLIASLTMGGVVFLSISLVSSPLLQLIMGVAIGAVVYLTIAIVFRFKEIQYLKELLVRDLN